MFLCCKMQIAHIPSFILKPCVIYIKEIKSAQFKEFMVNQSQLHELFNQIFNDLTHSCSSKLTQ